jgi:type I restriction enzyme M protein
MGRRRRPPETGDTGEPFEEKMTRLTGELSELIKRSHEQEIEIQKIFAAMGFNLDIGRLS